MHTSVHVPKYLFVTMYTSRGYRLKSCVFIALHIIFGEGSLPEHDTCLPLQAKLAGEKPRNPSVSTSPRAEIIDVCLHD